MQENPLMGLIINNYTVVTNTILANGKIQPLTHRITCTSIHKKNTLASGESCRNTAMLHYCLIIKFITQGLSLASRLEKSSDFISNYNQQNGKRKFQ